MGFVQVVSNHCFHVHTISLPSVFCKQTGIIAIMSGIQPRANQAKQKSIGLYFKKKDGSRLDKSNHIPIVQVQGTGVTLKRCPNRSQQFSSQGFGIHIKFCNGSGHRKTPFGRVKVVASQSPVMDQHQSEQSQTSIRSIVDYIRANPNALTSDVVKLFKLDCSQEDSEDSDDSEYSDPEEQPSANTTGARLTLEQRCLLIDHYNSSRKPTLSATAEWGRKEFKRATLTYQTVATALGKQDALKRMLKSSGQRHKKQVLSKHSRSGRYPDMEVELVKRVLRVRDEGIPYETFMLKLDAMDVLQQMKPLAAPQFKASSSWVRSFLKRHGLSHRAVTTRSSLLGAKKQGTESSIIEHFRQVQSLQLSEMNDSEWGITSPYGVFNRDQVPIALCSSVMKTLEETGRTVRLILPHLVAT